MFDRLRMATILVLAASGAVLWNAGPAAAHSFKVAIVAPDDAGDSALQSAYRGFRLATKERDGHAGEESDGHLGGLDVYIELVDGTLPGPELARALQGAAADVVVIIGSGVPPDAVEGSAVVMSPSPLPDPDTWQTEPTRGTGGPFGPRFSADYQLAPDEPAARGYNAARRIDIAVRTLAGVDDKTALADGLAATQDGIQW